MSHSLYDLLRKLEEARIHYNLSSHRDDAVLVTVYLVGERIEVDVFSDGHMEVSRFLGTEDVLGGSELIYDMIEKSNFEDKMWENGLSIKRKNRTVL